MGEELNNREDAKGDPVDEPLGIVLFGARLDGMNGHIRRI